MIDDKKSNSSLCPVCGVETNIKQSTSLRRGEGLVLYCASCDHGFLSQGALGDLKNYYETGYRKEYSHISEVAETNPQEIFSVYSKFQTNRLPYITKYLNTESTRLLEVGASAGQFLTHIKDSVRIANAIELDKSCCTWITSNLKIECDSNYLEESKFSNNEYDIICAFQVMEHVQDPIHFLSSLKNCAGPGAKIFVEVPNLRDPLLTTWNVPSHHDFFYHAAHLHYFTENSLKNTAIRAGFSPLQMEIVFTQDYNLLNHLHWIMNGVPQSDCNIGMSDINLQGHNHEIVSWLNENLLRLNEEYIQKLVSHKQTSNMMLILSND